jgi:hypothetical protein
MDLRGIGWEGEDWIFMAKDRDQWQTCEHGNELLDFIKGVKFDWLSDSI